MMRKFFVALLVGAVAVGMAVPAFAADLKFTGAYRVRFQFDSNSPCLADESISNPFGEVDCSGNVFQTRFRPRFDVETEGGVKGVLRLEIGDVRFGNSGGQSGPGSGGGHGADGANVETKWAYIDFPLPATPLRVKAGIQDFFLSKALFLDDDGSGISVYGKLGEVNAKAWWFRPNRGGSSGGAFENQVSGLIAGSGGLAGSFPNEGVNVDGNGKGARDILALDLSMSPVKDLNLNLYFVYDHDQEQAAFLIGGAPLTTDTSTGYWIGAAVAGKAQNIRYDFDFVYGDKETVHPNGAVPSSLVDQSGWMVDGGVGMSLPGTPFDIELRGWYATGWDGKGSSGCTSSCGDIDAFPVLYGGSGGHEPGTQVWGGGGAIDIDEIANNPQNTWGIGLIGTYTVSPSWKITANIHYIGVVEEGKPEIGQISPIGDGFLFGVDAVGTEIGMKHDITIARGLVFTLTAGHLFLAEDKIDFGPGIGKLTVFDDVTKFAGVLNYGF